MKDNDTADQNDEQPEPEFRETGDRERLREGVEVEETDIRDGGEEDD
jgi:hypothetical protein